MALPRKARMLAAQTLKYLTNMLNPPPPPASRELPDDHYASATPINDFRPSLIRNSALHNWISHRTVAELSRCNVLDENWFRQWQFGFASLSEETARNPFAWLPLRYRMRSGAAFARFQPTRLWINGSSPPAGGMNCGNSRENCARSREARPRGLAPNARIRDTGGGFLADSGISSRARRKCA